MKKYIIIIAVISLFGLGIIFLTANNSSEQTSPTSEDNLALQGEEIPIQGRQHIKVGESHSPYNSNPPTSGWHYQAPAEWGFYENPAQDELPDELFVHNLEHGGIWISYKDVDEATKQALKAVADKYNQAVVITPRSQNKTAIALASWGRLLKLEEFDRNRVENFIMANINNSPEKFASLEKGKVVHDEPAPNATFTTLDNRELQLSEFKGQKVMFWLFATWCPSCAAGAQVMEENNDKLGDLTIIALETHGNAGYRGPSVEAFAKKYAPQMLAAPNWLWGNAPQEATNTYNPKNYPDIFFLIDEEGIVRDVDGAPAATINKIIEFANE